MRFEEFSPGNPDDRAVNALPRGVDVPMSVNGALTGFLPPRQLPGREIPKRVSPIEA
jgi:hypothetical protein